MTTSAVCNGCGQPMNPGTGCTVPSYKYGPDSHATAIERIPYSQETRFIAIDPEYSNTRTICHDCNVAPGQLHHPGCDMEECPKCHGQAISCFCE